ncbi:hypothetical protein WCT55_23230 [Pectobacterium parmentieri]|uniref:hypothetical protein n=1 Tax=Pectobacterium parmentieri TaxID=1905730 RepID=UPI00301810AE|nr:hypothetical protein [Pectobacterium parmentieri]
MNETAAKVMQEFADELGCRPDNEIILQAIDDLKSKVAELEARLAAYDRAAEKPVAWMVIRDGDLTFPRVFEKETLADWVINQVTLNPRGTKVSLFTAPPLPVVPDKFHLLAEQAAIVEHSLDELGVGAGDYADNPQLRLWGRVYAYGGVQTPKCSTQQRTLPVVPNERTDSPYDPSNMYRVNEHEYNRGWNACRAAMLQHHSGDAANAAKVANATPEAQADGKAALLKLLEEPQSIQLMNHSEQQLDMVNSPVIPEGWVLVPREIHLDASDIASICSQCGDGGHMCGEFTEGVLWVGHTLDEPPVHGLHISNADYPEEGCITLVEFAAAPHPGESS